MGCSSSRPKSKSKPKPVPPMTNPYANIYKQVQKDEEKTQPLRLEEVRVPEDLLVSAEDFEVTGYLQEGGMGKVYSAVRKRDGRKVALKLFGYTKRLATPDDIQHEIDLMSALKGVEGFIQTEGIFWDTEKGLIPESKQHPVACPVIVMELMEGGELFDRMHTHKEISEKYIARIFKAIIIALDSMHKKGFVHRDFKLENAMMVSKDKDSDIRIIDFGMVCKIPSYTGIYRGSVIQGTPGYIAPESILYHTYSAKTDLWQAGCTLYSLLSGLLPFNREDYEQVTHQRFYPMQGVGWDNISQEAKDLVRKILTRNPERRISAAEILKHPWIVSEAPDVQMGDDYFARIKQLALRQKLKCFFLDTRLEERNKLRRNQLQLLLPFLASPPTPSKNVENASQTPPVATRISSLRHASNDYGSSGSLCSDDEHMQAKLKNLKGIIIPSLASSYKNDGGDDFTKDMTPEQKLISQRITTRGDCHNEESYDQYVEPTSKLQNGDNANTMSSTIPVRRVPSLQSSQGINYETFENMMNDCGLPELAHLSVFKIFDLGNTGYIDLKDFLLTMIAFREDPDPTPVNLHPPMLRARSQSMSDTIQRPIPNKNNDDDCKPNETVSEEAARLYFNVFDYKELGYIDKEELRTVVACILQDQAENDLDNNLGGVNFNVEDLFEIIDVKKNGQIDYEEFKQFYDAVLTNTNTRRSIILDKDLILAPHLSSSKFLRRSSSSAAGV